MTQSTLTGAAQPETISYTYDKTQQTGKTTVLSPWSSRTQTFAYNLQGLLSEVTASTTSSSTTSVASKTIYGYDSDGTRIRSTLYERFVPEGYDPENPPIETLVLKSTTEYLTDDRNPTGYSQVLTETAFDANGAVSKKTIYSVGHDQISQTIYDYSASSQQPTVTSQFFGTDGHGSVRVLVDAVAAIVRDPAFQLQLYTFDAYGNLLGRTNAQPLTSYLYSGESFDFSRGLNGSRLLRDLRQQRQSRLR